tara:strand:+ start:113 stop:499 length:387 start_codon:yes stop_codon:yes gene_type:complete
MSGIAVKLPISRDHIDGIKLIKNYKELARQNLKMLVLTVPGERMMDPEFGVGARRFLFEQLTQSTFERFKSRLLEQQQKYLPYLVIQDVQFISALTHPNVDENTVNIKIKFFNKVLKTKETLELPITV